MVAAIKLCLCGISGVSVEYESVTSDTQSMEIDLVLFNSKAQRGVPFLDHMILVECKNWSSPVDAKAVRDFIAKVRAARRKEAILVAASGITGNAREIANAHDELRRAFDADGVMIFVLTREQLETFGSAGAVIAFFRSTFGKIILRKNQF